MKAREFIKRATIYALGFGLYAYEFVIATIEGLGLNAKGFWGEPTRMVEPDDHVAVDPVAKARAEMLERAARDFDQWQKMTPADRAASIKAREEKWTSREREAQVALAAYRAEIARRWKEWDTSVDAWVANGRQGTFPAMEYPPFPKEAEPIPQNLVVGAPFEKESLS
jgi:hypothetical protein